MLINLKVSCSDRHDRKVSIEHVNRECQSQLTCSKACFVNVVNRIDSVQLR